MQDRTVVYSKMQWLMLGSAHLWKLAYRMVGSGDWSSKWHCLVSCTARGPQSSMEPSFNTEVDIIDSTKPVAFLDLLEEVTAGFRVQSDATHPKYTLSNVNSKSWETCMT